MLYRSCSLVILIVFYFLFESFSYMVMKELIHFNLPYYFQEWVYYFYFPQKKFVFDYYLYFLITSGVFFSFTLFYRIKSEGKDNKVTTIIMPCSFSIFFLLLSLTMLKHIKVLFIFYIIGMVYAFSRSKR
jgi:hypothetical protein